MDYKRIIEEGELIYSSRMTDSTFREWRQAKTMCNICYYETTSLTKLDRVILLTLEKNERICENQLAKMLGFNLEDDFDACPKRYADKGEQGIFQGLLSEIDKYGLISRKDKLVCLSNIGKLALKKEIKYSFYRGKIALLENFDINPKESYGNKMFPFRDALGICTSVQFSTALQYEDYDIPMLENLLYGQPSELISRLSLQCQTQINIYKAETTSESRMGEISVDFRLYDYHGVKYPLVFHNNILSIETNQIFLQEANKGLINQKIHIGEYLYLIYNSTNSLTYDSLMPFKDIWNLDDFLDNNRLVWNDNRLFNEIASKANGTQWNVISSLCPTEDLAPHLQEFKEFLDWIVLSTRYEDDFIIDTATTYPWDFETLSADRNSNFVKKIIVIPGLHHDIDWDWETILTKVEDNFVIENISNIPFDMFSVSEKYLGAYPDVIVGNPDKRWNWKYISATADLYFILDNISKISNYIELDTVMYRAFVSDKYIDAFCESSEFAFAVIQKKDWLQNRYNANKAKYLWNIKLIDWHEHLGFITWQSINDVDGLECNPDITWTNEIFEHYKDKTFSIKGLNHISKSITKNVSIELHPDFKWNWSILSGRRIVTDDINFVERHISHLSLTTAIPLISANYLSYLYNSADFKLLCTKQNAWEQLTNFIEKATILRNVSEPNWDWRIITQKFCSTFNFKALDKLGVLNKLDWNYISENADTEKILDCFDEYVDKWDWTILTRRLEHDFIVNNLQKYYLYWDWHHILTDTLTDEDLQDSHLRIKIAIIFSQLESDVQKELWHKFTVRFSTDQMFNIIQSNAQLSEVSVKYNWDYNDVYNRSDFDINKILCEYKKSDFPVDWDELSASKALNKILLWNKKVNKDFTVWQDVVLGIISNDKFHWNFKYLSTLTSINWCDNILLSRLEEWDWNYLSKHSRCFSYNVKRPNEIVRHIRQFEKYLDFGILSKRTDITLTNRMLSDVFQYNWDWNAISSNRGFELSFEFVQLHKTLSWDWFELSSRRDCVFTPEFILDNKSLSWNWQILSKRKEIPLTSDIIIKLIEKDWNWGELIKRNDLSFDEDMLYLLIDKDIDWRIFSQRDDFYPTMKSLKVLKDKKLDWDCISKRLELPYEVIVYYKDNLNWSILTNSTIIDLSRIEILRTFKDNLNWDIVSMSQKFVPTIEKLNEFKKKVNWTSICNRQDVDINENFLDTFESLIDWNRISQIGTIHFTKSLIDRYKDRWDWVALSKNPAFKSSGLEQMYHGKVNLVEFYNNLKNHRSDRPFIYHFTHLFNAIEVIKTKKILSRNRATELGLLKYDAAGSVVNRSAKAHPYARFYYRTGTQTQFYNECLGKQRGSKYFNRAESNGLPMCPMPVFFKFDLQEVLANHSNICYYSTGNLQTNWAIVYKVTEDPDNMDCIHLFSSNNRDKEVREKKQQEFLVKSEFDFSELSYYQIICYDQEETDILKSIFKGDSVCEHIFCVEDTESVFENENLPLKFDLSNQKVEIKTNYLGEYIFQVESTQISKIRVNNPSCIKAIKGNIMQLRKYISVELSNVPFDIYYVNMNPNARSPRWLIYQYTPEKNEDKISSSDIVERFLGISFEDDVFSPENLITSLELIMPILEDLYNTRVRHYVVKTHTLLVCKQFEKYVFAFNTNYMSINHMRIVLAIHDIGKAIDRSNQHEHTLSLVNELWRLMPLTEYELNLTKVLLKNDNMGMYFQGKLNIDKLKKEIIANAKELEIPQKILLQYKMVLYQCDVASYTQDGGGLKYLEHMFVYENGNKVFDDSEGILVMSPTYAERYNLIKSETNE